MTKKQAKPGIFTGAAGNQGQYVLAPQPPAPFYPPVPREALPDGFTVSVSVMTDPDATVATATLAADPYSAPILRKTGSSKRMPGDSYDPETGTALAVARALHRLANDLEKKAGGRVRHAEDARLQRAIRRLEKRGTGVTLPPELEHVIRAHLKHGDGDIKVHMIPLRDGDSLPPEFYAAMSQQFPGVTFTADPFEGQSIESLGGEIGKMVDEFLADPEASGVRRARPEKKGKHRKEAGSAAEDAQG